MNAFERQGGTSIPASTINVLVLWPPVTNLELEVSIHAVELPKRRFAR
jgi:hypothetical protein